jgi:glycosyltransferase involved in cell wall biosynthesis
MDKFAIHCVIPTLNSAATLETTLVSLLTQADVQLRLTVADSHSTDATLRLCAERNIQTVFAEPGNMYRAINLGLRDSQTEWLTYLNSDDWLYPDSYRRLMEAGEAAQADLVYGNCDYADGAGRFVYSFAAARPEQLLALFRCRRMGFAQPAAIFRRTLWAELKGFDESYRYKADADFFIRALQAGKRFVYVDGPAIACFRVHASQLSLRNVEEIEQEGQRLFGQAALQPNRRDWLTLLAWRYRNAPHYLLRMLRASLLAQRLRAPQSLETYDHR